MLTQEELKRLLTYEPETGIFRWCRDYGELKGKVAGSLRKTGYVKIHMSGIDYTAHRLAWLYVYGYFPKELDHINGDGADNRISNLREATHSQNGANAKLRIDNKVGMRGIYWNKTRGRWYARVWKDGKATSRHFDDLEEAKAFIAETHVRVHGKYSGLYRELG